MQNEKNHEVLVQHFARDSRNHEELVKHIYNVESRLCNLENEVRDIKSDTKDLVLTFQSLTGFLAVIDFLYRMSKPVMWFFFVCAAAYYYIAFGLKLPLPELR